MAFFKVAVLTTILGLTLGAPQSQSSLNDLEYEQALARGEMFDPNPVYNYAFQVADDEAQTYIAKQEARDGADVTGEYSYVDANGALITVRYIGNSDGYSETREVQENFVTIRAQPVRAQSSFSSSSSSNSGSSSASNSARRVTTTSTTSSSGSNDRLVGQVVQQIRPAVQRVVTTETSSSSANADDDLVARIVAQLTPFIQQTVSNSVNGQQTTTTRRVVQAAPRPVQQQQTVTRTVVAAAPIPVARPAVTKTTSSSSTTQGIFGVSGANNIRFDTPDFNYAFDL